MSAKTKLITVDSYFGIFPILVDLIEKSGNSIDQKNLIFCEEKISLMTERQLCARLSGTFNTDVYSFGNFLRVNKSMDNLLSKEGSAMVIKRILSQAELKCFNRSKEGLAPSLYELISQLKSAKVYPDSLKTAILKSDGILKNKIADVIEVFETYEKYLKDNSLEDQSSALEFLPKVIEDLPYIENANIYIVGFSGFTVQVREVIKTLIRKAKTVTAILPKGENEFVFVNETADIFSNLSLKENATIETERKKSDYVIEGSFIKDGLFNPSFSGKGKMQTDKVIVGAFKSIQGEVDFIANKIKDKIKSGECRYRDITLIVPDISRYQSEIEKTFSLYDIPYFADRKITPINHPLITLINSYIEIYRKGFTVESGVGFYSNLLFCSDKDFTDRFTNYLYKYNVNYGRIKTPFTLPALSTEELAQFEEFRLKIVSALEDFSHFDVLGLINRLNVKEKIAGLTERLNGLNEREEGAINGQIYEAVIKILGEMQKVLGGVKITYNEYKKIFASGISALTLSIIPQYNDAVFIGGFKEAGLIQAKHVFAMGLSSSVPSLKNDVALLSDGDITALSEVNLLIEPKIRIINHRSREETAMGLSAFKDSLYLTYSVSGEDGKTIAKSEIFSYVEKMFTLKEEKTKKRYLTEKRGLRDFAVDCSDFVEGKKDNMIEATSYYKATDNTNAKYVIDSANREIQIRLNKNADVLINGETSPTAIEDYYKCPYQSFLSHTLRLKERDTGSPDALSFGSLSHEIFKAYSEKLYSVYDEESSHRLFADISGKILQRDEYKKYLLDAVSFSQIKGLLAECEKYCYKNYLWSRSSKFITDKKNLEVKFGDNAPYSAIPLLNGRVKISGKIDRVDTFNDCCRIIDYKTGRAEMSDKLLFAGTKLQLFLYAAAVREKKKPIGVYYLPVSDAYSDIEKKQTALTVGKTTDDMEMLIAQDENLLKGESSFIEPSVKDGKSSKTVSDEIMKSYIDYSLLVSENAVKQMEEGVIIPSPLNNACESCSFKGMCDFENVKEREIKGVTSDTLKQAVKGEKDA